jgi:hypothetical protein
MATTSAPIDQLFREKFVEYVSAVGRVAYAWNHLQESLGQIFAAVVPGSPHNVMLAIWYSEPNDRAQRRLLRAAVNAGALDRRPLPFPKHAADDILWLLERADNLGFRRDQTIHAPCSMITDAEGTEMAAAFYHGNPLAKQLKGKKLLTEFAFSEWRAEQLIFYSQQIYEGLLRGTWPSSKPALDRLPRRQPAG